MQVTLVMPFQGFSYIGIHEVSIHYDHNVTIFFIIFHNI